VPRIEFSGGPGLHQVLFYEDPLELVRTIGETSAAALDEGGSVVLVAQHEHLDAVDEWIRLSASLRSRKEMTPTHKRYRRLDVDTVIEQFDFFPNPAAAFKQLLDAACDGVPTSADVVHMYGDLMGTLWESGQPNVAMEIERIGSGLAAERGMSVICAYPASALAVTDFVAIGQHHTHVIPTSAVPPHTMTPAPSPIVQTPAAARSAHEAIVSLATTNSAPDPANFLDEATLTKVFPASLTACRAARHFVRSAMEELGSSRETADAAELICGELAANAVRHAHSAFTVRVSCGRQGIRVAVGDEAPEPTEHVSHSGEGPYPVVGARGLGIVSALAAHWGVDDQTRGKIVWADVSDRRGAA
jgi:anti-sigma regulatory factor (Ser/Thr protein kinase)